MHKLSEWCLLLLLWLCYNYMHIDFLLGCYVCSWAGRRLWISDGWIEVLWGQWATPHSTPPGNIKLLLLLFNKNIWYLHFNIVRSRNIGSLRHAKYQKCLLDLRFSLWLWRFLSFGIYCCVAWLKLTCILEKHIASIFRVQCK